MSSMYAIAFDLSTNDLKTFYGEPYNNAYSEIKIELEALGFKWIQGSIYASDTPENGLAQVYLAINTLSKIEWFKESVKDIRAFKIEDFSNFTSIIKGSK